MVKNDSNIILPEYPDDEELIAVQLRHSGGMDYIGRIPRKILTGEMPAGLVHLRDLVVVIFARDPQTNQAKIMMSALQDDKSYEQGCGYVSLNGVIITVLNEKGDLYKKYIELLSGIKIVGADGMPPGNPAMN